MLDRFGGPMCEEKNVRTFFWVPKEKNCRRWQTELGFSALELRGLTTDFVLRCRIASHYFIKGIEVILLYKLMIYT